MILISNDITHVSGSFSPKVNHPPATALIPFAGVDTRPNGIKQSIASSCFLYHTQCT